MYNHHFIGMHWIWWIILTIFIMLIIFNVVPYHSSTKNKEDALDILKKRYARGEIEEEEYRERKKIIEQSNN